MGDHGEYRVIYPRLLQDDAFVSLPPLAKLVWFALKLHLPTPGIGKVSRIHLASVIGCQQPELAEALSQLTPKWVICHDDIVWLPRALMFQPGFSPRDWKHRVFVERKVAEVGASPLVAEFWAAYPEWSLGKQPVASETPHPGALRLEEPSKPLPRAMGRPSKQVAASPARDDSDTTTLEEFSIALIAAANRGIAENPCLTGNPRRLNPSLQREREVAGEIQAAGVPLGFAEGVIYDAARAFEGEGRGIHSLRYFLAKVLERWAMQLPRDSGETSTRRAARRRTFNGNGYAARPADEARDNSLKTHPDVKRTIDEHRGRLGVRFDSWWQKTVAEAKRMGRWPSVYAYDLIRSEQDPATRDSEDVADA